MFAAKRLPFILPVNSGVWGSAPIHRAPRAPKLNQMRQTSRLQMTGGPDGQA